ncbi:PKD domain-containing protein [Cupriavidus necator]|uniref:PKD domain-containing protein n=1 Tax=Cupriavidus necator TaxID=106590 RepID=UPI000F4FA4A0|nr:PKD domain-containing protein [Cupriavidus necator]
MIDLNTRIPGAPPGLELNYAFAISDNGSIVANSNVGLVLLKPGPVSTAPPVVGPISANDPVAVGALVSVSASFTDADVADTHTAIWSWGDGSASTAGTVSESNGAGTVAGTHTYSAAGVYSVTVTVTDNTSGIPMRPRMPTWSITTTNSIAVPQAQTARALPSLTAAS